MQVQFSKWQVVNKYRSKNLNWDVETELISILTVKAYLVWYQDQNSYSNWSYLVNILNSLNLNVIVHTRHLFQLFAYALQNIYRIHFGNLECNYFPQKNGTRICELKKKKFWQQSLVIAFLIALLSIARSKLEQPDLT